MKKEEDEDSTKNEEPTAQQDANSSVLDSREELRDEGEVDDSTEKEDPRIVWILERIMAFCQTENRSLIVRMLKKHDSRALKRLYLLINSEGPDYQQGFFVYETQFKRTFKKKTRYMKIHLKEGEGNQRYRCSVQHDTRYRDEVFKQLHMHFDLHRWERFPHKGKIFYFLPREKKCVLVETLREAAAVMPKMFYVGQMDIQTIRNYRPLCTILQLYLKHMFLNPTNPFSQKTYTPSGFNKSREEMKRPTIFEIENSASYMKKCEDIEKLLLSEDVASYPEFNLQLFKRLEGYGMTKKREKFNIYTIDDFLNPEVFARNPKIRSLWYKRKKGPIPKFKERGKVALMDITPPKSKTLMAFDKLIENLDWCISKLNQCTINVLFTDFLAKLDVHKFDHDEELKQTHLTFLEGVIEICNLHIKNLLKYCDNVTIKGKGVISLYEYYRQRRDKMSNLVFEMFHPIVENLMSFVVLSSPGLVAEFKEVRSRLENFYIICWDTCEYLEFCLQELETIHNHKMLRPIIPCSTRFLKILKMLLLLSFYWKTNNRFLDILNRLHYIIQSKIERLLNTEHLFRLPNRIATSLCEDVICVSEYWQSTVEQDRAFSQKINFEKLNHLRNVAQTIMEILRVMKSYNHVYCQQCYDAENDNYKLDAVVYEVKQLIEPVVSPNFDYLDVDNKAQWDDLVKEFKNRCALFDKEASLLIVEAIKKTKSTKNIASILTHFKTSTKFFKMDSLFNDIFNNLDISSQFSQEILQILEIFLKASYNKDSMRSFGYASKSMQWTRCLFYVVQKNLNTLFSIGSVLTNVYEKVIVYYLRCVDIFTSYEVGLYKVWLKRYVNYVHDVVSKKIVQLAYEKEMADDNEDGCPGFLAADFLNKIPAYSTEQNVTQGSQDVCEYLPQFRPYLMDALQEEQMEKLASLHSFSSGEENESDEHAMYKKNLLLKFGLDLDNWYSERYMLNYNFVTRLALGMCTQNDEQLEANVYFLLEQTLKRFLEEDDKVLRKRDKSKLFQACPFIQTYDCCSSSGSVTRISELLTENSWSVNSSNKELQRQVNSFIVDRNPQILQNVSDISSLQSAVPLFIAIRENFKDKISQMMGGDPVEIRRKFATKTEEVLDIDQESACSEDFMMPELDEQPDSDAEVHQETEIEELHKYKVLFKTSIEHLYNFKEMSFVLWLNGTKMRFIKPPISTKKESGIRREGGLQHNKHQVNLLCSCERTAGKATTKQCPDCAFDWLEFDANSQKLDGNLLNTDKNWDTISYKMRGSKIEESKSKRKRHRRHVVEKYDTPMNDIFVDEENADALFRKKLNIFLAKLINESNLPGEAIGPKEISSRVRGSILQDGTLDDKYELLCEVTDDDMPEQKINAEINALTEMQKTAMKTTKRRFKKELQEAIRQADFGTSESEKEMKAIDYEEEIKKAIPGIYTGCKHSLKRMNWSEFIGKDILKEHGYTLQANRQPFTYVACRDIETLEEFGFALPTETLAFAFNNFDRNKHDILEIVEMYKGIIGRYSVTKLMALKPYIRPVERDICEGLNYCGLRTLNITKQCNKLIVEMNRLAIVEILMTEIEVSIKNILHTVSRLNYYRMPSGKSFSLKDFFSKLNQNIAHTQSRLEKLSKLIPQKLLKLEMLLYHEKTGKCEYLIMYYRCVEKMLFKKLIMMIKANLNIFRKFVMGELTARFYVVASLIEPTVLVSPDLKAVKQHLDSTAEKIIRYQKKMPRWFDGTCSKVPLLKKKGGVRNTHMYSFAEDLLGSQEVAEELQRCYECISYVIDTVGNYVKKWSRFDHLWVEDIEEVFTKFALEKPSLQDYFDVFNFYHQIIVETYKMPDQIDIYCVRVKIKEIKKRVLSYAFGWRAFTNIMLSHSITAENHTLFDRMENTFSSMAATVTSFQTMRKVLKTAYFLDSLEIDVDILLNSITAKNFLAKYWLPKHLYNESSVRTVILFNMKQLKQLALYRQQILLPYLSKITPRNECIQCSPSGLIADMIKAHDKFPNTLNMAMKEFLFGGSLRRTILHLVNEVESIVDSCPWAVAKLTLDHLQIGLKVIEWLKLLHPKLNVQQLMNSKHIFTLLKLKKPMTEEKSDLSVEAMLKFLK